MKTIRRVFLVVATTFFAIAGPAAGWATPPDAAKARAFVHHGLDEAFDVLRQKDLTEQQKAKKLENLLQTYFDVPTIAKFALGRYRRQANEQQMKAYLAAFRDFLAHAYINRIVTYSPSKNEKTDDILRFTGVRAAGSSDLFVDTEISRPNAEPIKIGWRVRDRDGKLAVIDVEVMGTSQLLTYRQEFASVIQRRGNGVDGLIAELKAKNAKGDSNLKKSSMVVPARTLQDAA